MNIKDIKKGDIVTYRSGRVNRVNKPYNYKKYFNNDFTSKSLGSSSDIVKIQRYVKFFWFYRLETIYERKESKESE